MTLANNILVLKVVLVLAVNLGWGLPPPFPAQPGIFIFYPGISLLTICSSITTRKTQLEQIPLCDTNLAKHDRSFLLIFKSLQFFFWRKRLRFLNETNATKICDTSVPPFLENSLLSLLPGTAEGGWRRQRCVTLTLPLIFFQGVIEGKQEN